MINKSIKIFVIALFITLIAGFVIYRSRKLTSILSSDFSSNSFINSNVNSNDTPGIDSAQTAKNRMMYSSKSMILTDIKFYKDTPSQNEEDSSVEIMGSSKSLTIIPPKQILKYHPSDTVASKKFIDSIFPKK